MILKTYTRIFTTDLDGTVDLLRLVHNTEPHLSFDFDPWRLVAIGDVLAVGGTDEALEPIRGSLGPWIVDDIAATRAVLLERGAEMVRDVIDVPTGQMMYVRHPDGSIVEYVQWHPELVERHIRAPLQAGTLSSQI